MKRVLATILIGCLALTLNLSVVEAAVKPGSACKKLGQVKKSAGIKYTCIKSGKKQVWKKGTASKSAAPAITPTPTPKPAAKLFELVPPNLETPITWSTVLDRRYESAAIVYADVQATVKRNKSLPNIDVPYRVYKGPNQNNSHYADLDSWLGDLFSFYARAVKPDSYIFLAFPYQDLEWAVSQLSKPEINHPGYEIIVRNANKSVNQGFRQNAVPNMLTGRFDGIWLLPANLSGTNDLPTRQLHEESTVNHEYAHQVQQAQWKDENLNGPNLGMGRDAPCFLVEGLATIPELALVIDDSDGFKRNLKGRIRGAYTSDPNTRDELGNFTGYAPLTEPITYDFSLSYLDNSFKPYCNSGLQYGLSYSLGYLATEALAVIGGVESPMALFTLMGKNNLTWNQAFEYIYGISWSEARPILANYIYLQAKDYRS